MDFGLGSRRVAGWITASMLLCAPSLALAEQGTSADREACTPDAFRLCGRYIPNADRIANCLQQAGPRLSPACYAVFYPPGTKARSTRVVKRRYASPPRRADNDDDDD